MSSFGCLFNALLYYYLNVCVRSETGVIGCNIFLRVDKLFLVYCYIVTQPRRIMNRLAQSHLDFEYDDQSGSNTWIAVLLAAIIVSMLLVFVAFDQQSKWWFGAIVNDLYVSSGYQMDVEATTVEGIGNMIYLLAAGCLGAVVTGFNLLRTSNVTDDETPSNTENHNGLLDNCKDHRMVAHFNQYDDKGERFDQTNTTCGVRRSKCDTHMFNMVNPKFCNLLNPSGQGQQNVFIYLDSEVDDHHGNLQHDIHGYFAHHGKSLRLIAPPQILSGHASPSLESQVSRIHQHVVSQHLDTDSQIVVIGAGDMVDMVSSVCRRHQDNVKLLQIPYH